MLFDVYFAFSLGLTDNLYVPNGTKASITEHVREIEKTLGLKRTKFGNETRWDTSTKSCVEGFSHLNADTVCEIIEKHNKWVRKLYEQFGHWSKNPVSDGELLTPLDAKKFWHGLYIIDLPPERWTPTYYTARMEALYEVMRGRKSEGMTFDTKALTPRQAACVIQMFSQFFPNGDRRLDVPDGRDYLASSYDGGYIWCDKCCKPKAADDCGCHRKKCPLALD